MLERYFTARMTMRRLRFGPSGPYIDRFAAALERDGYAEAIAKRYLRAAVHLGYFLQQQGKALTDIDSTTPEMFSRHLATCCCPLSSGEGNNHHPYFGVKRYCDYLVQIGVCSRRLVSDIRAPEPPAVTSFRQWLKRHRGAAEPTIKQYCRAAADVMTALGDDPSCWTPKDVRGYFFGTSQQAWWHR
jgi:hypothetical protein